MKMQTNYNPDVLSCLANLSSDEVFTPPKLANEILDLLPKELWKDKDATFLDPVSKSGVFLREIAKRLLEGLQDEIPNLEKRIAHVYTKQIFGIGITELTSLLGRRSVYCSKDAHGKYSILESFSDNQGNIFFDNTNHEWKNGRCSYCGASQSEYEREQGLETHAYQFIHNNLPDKIKNMKFDVIIGNPPYQLCTGGAQAQATPLYDKFVLQAKKMKPRYLTMIVPARWYTGGFGLNDFREEMLNDKRLRVLVDYPASQDCFPGVQIKGGVCYFLWSRDHDGLCKIKTIRNAATVSEMERDLLTGGNFIRFNEAVDIYRKVKSKKETTMDNIVSSQKPFGFATNYTPQKYNGNNKLVFYGNKKIATINRDLVEKNIDAIDKYKVFISAGYGAGEDFPHQIINKPFIGEPGSICSETYIFFGPIKNKTEANNLISYIKTKFFRFLVMLRKNDQHALKRVYSFVPTQDFSEAWTDEKLYKKYKLTKEEIEFIESMIRPMN